MIAIHDIAEDFREMQLAGRVQDAAEKYWSADIKSIEPADLSDGTPAIVRGLRAAREKLIRRLAQNAIEDIAIDGPFITGNRFALFIDMQIVDRATGIRRPFSEIAIFTVRDGKIAEERFFYDTEAGEDQS